MYEDETPDAFLISGTYDEMVTEARFILSDFQDTAVKPTLAIFKYQDGYQYDIVGEDYKNLSLFNNKIAGDKITTVLKWKGDEIVELRINDI